MGFLPTDNQHEVVVMSLPSFKNVIKKLMILNATRMADIRNKTTITPADNADYEDRYREAGWYASTLGDIEESERLNRIEGDMSFARDTLKANIQRKLEARYDEVLDKTRKLGAGTMRDSITGEIDDCEGDTMSQNDRKFLRSCGIKTERGETWTP